MKWFWRRRFVCGRSTEVRILKYAITTKKTVDLRNIFDLHYSVEHKILNKYLLIMFSINYYTFIVIFFQFCFLYIICTEMDNSLVAYVSSSNLSLILSGVPKNRNLPGCYLFVIYAKQYFLSSEIFVNYF